MSKKRKRPTKKVPKRANDAAPRGKKKRAEPDKLQDVQSPPHVDRRALEKTMADIGRLLNEQDFESIDEANRFIAELLESGQPIESVPHTPAEQAQDIMYDAWEEEDSEQRISLARKALRISADCADAYVLLAEEASRTIQQALGYYKQGVHAGERALGPETFEEEGHFWGDIRTRPYMRAREGLAEVLWLTGDKQECIRHYREMLRLNPGDNQGVRYRLLTCLLRAGDNADVAELLEAYEDEESASWLYSRALWLYRKDGPGRRASAALRRAVRQNPHVLEFLLGKKELPDELPHYVGFGDENEAVDYLSANASIWLHVPGALDWLAQRTH